jgi:copper chaperone CopZ
MFKKNKKIIKIKGMHCNHCAKSVMDALLKIDNIKKVDINLKKQEAVVTLKNDILDKEIIEVIESLDYKVEGIYNK